MRTGVVTPELPQVVIRQFGLPGDHPVPGNIASSGYAAGEYAKLVVWRPSTGRWYTCNWMTGPDCFFNNGSGVAVPEIQLGAPTDIPVPGDYLGRFGSQFAVWSFLGGWRVVSGEDEVQTEWGLPGDLPVPLDIGNVVQMIRAR